MQTHPVLVTAVGGNVGQGVIKSLRASRYDFHIIGLDMEPLAAGFSLCDSHYTVPRTGNEGFADTILRICEKERIEAVYVCSPGELAWFAENKPELEKSTGAKFFVNSPDAVRIGSDKLLTANFLRDHGLPYPDSAMIDDEENVRRIVKTYGFPLITKPYDGCSSKNVFLVNSEKEIDAVRTLVPDSILQQYLSDDNSEYTAAVSSTENGEPFACIILHRHLVQGTTYRTELFRNEKIGRQIMLTAEKLGSRGPCNMQFRIHNGQCYIFEINPRISGTSGIRFHYRFNDAELLFETNCLDIAPYQPELRPAVTMRYWNEIVIQEVSFADLKTSNSRHNGKESVVTPSKRKEDRERQP